MSDAKARKISACPSWLGLSEDKRSFVYLEDRAAVIKKIFELSIGGFGSYAIAKHLNTQRVPPFPPSKKWDHTTIDSMLRNRATIGEHQPKSYVGNNKKGLPVGRPIANYYPAVITEEVFKSAQSARQNNLAVRRGRQGEEITNLFTGLTRCEYCRRQVQFSSHNERKSLVCESVQKNEGCFRVGWSYKNFEQSVLLFLCHPALRDFVSEEKRPLFDELVALITAEMHVNRANARFEIVKILRSAVQELTLACAGNSPKPSLAGALIRRNLPNRYFRIRLWEGPLFRGFPIPVED